MIEQGFYEYMMAKDAIRDIVSDRIYAIELPQGVSLPAIVYHKVTAPRTYHLQAQTDLVFATFQVDCLADTYEAANKLADTVRLAMSGYSGTMGDHDVTSVAVENMADFVEQPEPGEEHATQRVVLDIRIGYRETVPTF